MTKERVKILCVHQGAELYGSDRSFLQAVQAIRESWPESHIRVIIAVDGPLRNNLSMVADEVVVRDLCVLRLANPFETIFKGSLGLPWYLYKSLKDVICSDIVYINTTVIADYMIAARFAAQKAVIHVREIPKPKAMPIIRALVKNSHAKIIYNSHATRAAFKLSEKHAQATLHNGVDPAPSTKRALTFSSFSASHPLRIAMLGRISDWKGQDLLIDSIANLSSQYRSKLKVRIVGSAFKNLRAPVDALEARIRAAGLNHIVFLEPFKDDPSEVYDWCDLCVVPSRLPEPFGRVAAEAMAYGRPVIAASHGGLVEIVSHRNSGWLVEPNDVDALSSAISEAIDSPDVVKNFGQEAFSRFEENFSSRSMQNRLRKILISWFPNALL